MRRLFACRHLVFLGSLSAFDSIFRLRFNGSVLRKSVDLVIGTSVPGPSLQWSCSSLAGCVRVACHTWIKCDQQKCGRAGLAACPAAEQMKDAGKKIGSPSVHPLKQHTIWWILGVSFRKIGSPSVHPLKQHTICQWILLSHTDGWHHCWCFVLRMLWSNMTLCVSGFINSFRYLCEWIFGK